MRFSSADPGSAMDPYPEQGHEHFFKNNHFLNKKISEFDFIFFSLIFMLKLDEPQRKEKTCESLSYFNRSGLDFESKRYFPSVFVDILTLGFGSMEPHIFADPWIQEAKMLRIRILCTNCTHLGLAILCPEAKTVDSLIRGFGAQSVPFLIDS